ncbi:hypothetical protein ACLB2K_051288 [Fragaria x ananassa]
MLSDDSKLTILVEKAEIVAKVEDQNGTNDLVLDGGFVVPKDVAENDGFVKAEGLVSNDEFIAPEINAFGQTFRDYNAESERQKGVEELYRLNHPQIEHLLQTAEAIRKDYPDEDWLHLTALIHDLGKVLLLPSFGGLPQWAVAGDTHPVGCPFDDSIVHHRYFKDNPDYNSPEYNSTQYGFYAHGIGLKNVLMSWGHDDYMYLVAKENGTTLPEAGLFIIRYHSFYPLHKCGAYKHLMSKEDEENLKWLKIFNKYDLYSKSKSKRSSHITCPFLRSTSQQS